MFRKGGGGGGEGGRGKGSLSFSPLSSSFLSKYKYFSLLSFSLTDVIYSYLTKNSDCERKVMSS